MELILASNSPRRKELLSDEGFTFSVVSSEYEEKAFTLDPIKTTLTFALGKAMDVFNKVQDKSNTVVLGADTIVYNDGVILNKPNGDEQAREMLKGLSNKTHKVITGYCIVSEKEVVSDYVTTLVTFNDLSDELISSYVKSGLYKGKSGSYGIQDPYPLVKCFDGSMNNVIGLPTEAIVPHLKRMLK